MQAFVDKYVAPVWGTPAKLIKSTGFVKSAWAMVFLEDADQPNAFRQGGPPRPSQRAA